jgi:hypothetical protein
VGCGSATDQPAHRFRLLGVQSKRRYRLDFQDHPAANRVLTGEELMQLGVDVSLALPVSSDLIFFEEVP